MRAKHTAGLTVVSLAILLCAASPVSAQIARVFLSGTGDDLNDCSNATTPCRSLQGAINQCPVNGEVIVLTSGGFGTANITKSLEINAPTAVVAFNARTITVNIGLTDTVVIRGLSMNGSVFGDAYGINFIVGGTLIVENSKIDGFATAGIRHGSNNNNAHPNLIVNNCEFRNGGHSGIYADGALGTLTVQDSRFVNNAYAGLEIFSTTYSTLKNSVISDNAGFGVIANGITYSVPPHVLIDRCVIAHNVGTVANASGIRAEQTHQGFGQVIIRVTNSSIYGNTVGVSTSAADGAVVSYGTNRLWNNTTDGAFTTTIAQD